MLAIIIAKGHTVRPSVRHTRDSRLNASRYGNTFRAVRYSDVSIVS